MMDPSPSKKKQVQWLWKADDDWTEYDAKVATRLESFWQQGKKEGKVDDERYVDFENMLQRRYDDVMKRRPVKREVPPIFDKEIFYVILPQKQKKELESTVEEYGGLVASALNKKVTHLVLRESDVPKKKKELDKAKGWKIPVVTPEFVEKCTAELDVVSDGEFRLDEGEEEEEEEEDKAGEKEDIKADKRKAEPAKNGGTDMQPQKKKSKTVADTDSAGDIYIQPKSCFSGVSEQEGFDPCPFMVTVLERDGNNFSGHIVWATLQTTTKFKGSVDGASVSLEEYELISGDDVEVPNKYAGTLEENGTIKGKLVDSHQEEGTFELKNISLPKVEPCKDNFRQNSIWKGICYTPFPFELRIEKRQKDAFTGTMSWPTIEDSKTKVRGTISDGKLEFEEFEVIKGDDDVDVPNYFTAPIDDSAASSFEGTFKGVGNPDPGRFEIKLS